MSESGGKGKSRKLGRDKVKCAAYRASKVREKNKIKRVLASNGYKSAVKYAREKGLTDYFSKLVKSKE